MTRSEARKQARAAKLSARQEMRQQLVNGINNWSRQLYRTNKEGQCCTAQAQDMIKWLKEKLEAFDKNTSDKGARE